MINDLIIELRLIMILYVFNWDIKKNKLGEFKINFIYKEFIIIVIIMDFFIKFKFFSIGYKLLSL